MIEPLLPNKPTGVPRVNDRRVLNGMFWVLHSVAHWRDLPERFGNVALYGVPGRWGYADAVGAALTTRG